MERHVTLFIASLCAAPLFFFVAGWPYLSDNRGNSDQTIANGYMGLLLGTAAAIVGFFVVGFLTNLLIGKGYLRTIQIADLIMVIGWGIVWFIYSDTQPWELHYADQNAILDIEIRASKDLLNGNPIDKVAGIRFAESGLTYYQPERIRQEGEFTILPWFTYLHRVKGWNVLVDLPQQASFFQMDLPKRPPQSTEWSNWIAPIPQPDYTTPAGLSIRYRFRLVPYGQDP
ncbi:hypothetical protein IC229_19730 [Spirosoma sp. BT702]|uniref:Uncharacterized protein n=1 Tax=Spirosoma profusum TaxID=2771354 RepID=A0A926Y2A0_9BACT|nr:hypothetical protein [Spirosoma profusum]MBD2702887.1 hypothetical protein [Spirosoma profusum]